MLCQQTSNSFGKTNDQLRSLTIRRDGGSPSINKGVFRVDLANKAGSKMSGEVYLLWLLSLLQTVSLLTLKIGNCRRSQ